MPPGFETARIESNLARLGRPVNPRICQPLLARAQAAHAEHPGQATGTRRRSRGRTGADPQRGVTGASSEGHSNRSCDAVGQPSRGLSRVTLN